MNRDVTQIDVGTCAQIFDDKTIITYTSTGRKVYTLVSNKYMHTRTYETSTPLEDVHCYTTEEIQTLPSTYDFMTPVFSIMSILSVLLIVYAAYRLILYPFFRKW